MTSGHNRSLAVAPRNGRLRLQPVTEPATVRERSTVAGGRHLDGGALPTGASARSYAIVELASAF